MSFFHFISSALAALWRDRRYGDEHFEQIKQRRLRALVKHAKEHVPFYSELYKGIDPEEFELTDLPPVDKASMMDNLGDTVADQVVTAQEILDAARDEERPMKWIKGKYLVSVTSGTSGQVGYFLNDRKSWQGQRGAVFARTLRDRLTPYQIARFSFGRRYRMAFVIAGGGPYITYQLALDNPRAASLIANIRQYSVLTPLEENVKALNEFRPHYLHGYPTYIESLAHERLAGRARFSPEFISLGSEPFTPVAKQVLKQAFPDAIISETYGATECLVLGNQCFEGRMHMNTDLALVEPVDEDDRPVPHGTPSHHVLITNLMNTLQPVIRYRLTDSVVFTGEQCPCGRSMPVMVVQGRTDDTIWLRDRNGVYQAHTPIPFEVIFLDSPGVIKYQLIHEWQNYLRVRFVCDPMYDKRQAAKRLAANFESYLARHGLDEVVNLDIEIVDDLERPEKGQKLRQIFSKVPPPGGR